MPIVTYKPYYTAWLRDIDKQSNKYPWWENSWSNIPIDLKIRVLVKDDLPLGFSAFQIDNKSKTMHILKLCVHPGMRLQGLGSLLHRDLLNIAQREKLKQLLTLVHEEVPATTIEWLQSWGWMAINLERNMYPDGRDAYLFERGVYL